MNELKKEFLPHQEALALKDLGFDEPCLMYWNDYGRNSINRFQLLNNIDEWCQDYIEAPLYQQAFDWFRKVHGIQVFPDYLYCDGFKYGFKWVCNNGDYGEDWNFKVKTDNAYYTPEEARLASLRKLIEIVKSK